MNSMSSRSRRSARSHHDLKPVLTMYELGTIVLDGSLSRDERTEMTPSFPKPRPAAATLDRVRRVVSTHFVEMPGLSLTSAQVRRLCGFQKLDLATCETFLDALVREGLLVRSTDGRYRRAA